MSFNYIIEPFGKITDTNGIYIGEDKKAVKFNLMKSKEYYVTFKDFFISSWFGGASKIVNREAKESSVSIDSEEEGLYEPENNFDELSNSMQELNEALVGDTEGPNKEEKTTISDEDVNSIIKEHCAKKWANDFNMRAYCQEQQIGGYNDLMKSKPAEMSDSDYQKIKTLCQNKWANDFNMMAYCEEQQLDGYDSLMKESPFGMSDGDFQTIKSQCASKWSNDFNMRAYCEKQQVDGWMSIQ